MAPSRPGTPASQAGSRTPSRAGPAGPAGPAAGARPSSRGSQTAPASQRGRASLRVPTGGVAFMSNSGAWEMYTTVGGLGKPTAGTASAGKIGMFTDGMTSCPSVIIVGPGGAILAHVTYYLINAVKYPKQADKQHVKELGWMKDAFGKLMHDYGKGLKFNESTVNVVAGPNTNRDDMWLLTREIFGFGSSQANNTWACDPLPADRQPRHGTVQVMVNPKEIFVEDIKKM